jgi:metal-sulfur cluster biosynthetic enzyme
MNPAPEPPTREDILGALRTVVDPEIGLNLVDLGLIYDIAIENRKVRVTFTLTTQGCPLQDAMAEGIRSAVLGLSQVEDCEVQLVWEPVWNPSMISDEGRAFLSEPC